MKKFVEKDVAENPLYHDTWKLLKKYRDVVWSLEISVQHVRAKFEIEYGTSIEEFLDSVYSAIFVIIKIDMELFFSHSRFLHSLNFALITETSASTSE